MKIIIWGLPLHSHTHSYIHQAFARASKAMGHETYWIENSFHSNDLLRQGDLVICCGVDDDKLMPKKGVNYVLHNSSRDDLRSENFINLQVYTHDVLKREVEDWGNLTFWQEDNRTLYQPWATDLLPEEIEKIEPCKPKKEFNDIMWIGSITTGVHGNYEEIVDYAAICQKNNFQFKHVRGVSIKENIDILRQSRHSIVIQGKWQVENGYVPCRIFKNISYGCWSFTNSSTVSHLLEIENFSNSKDMFDEAEKHVFEPKVKDLSNKMSLVKDKHTYVNRLKNIIKILVEE
jgi:hypothetical protein